MKFSFLYSLLCFFFFFWSQKNQEAIIQLFRTNGNKKAAGVAILVSDKVDYKAQPVTKGKEGRDIMTKASIQDDKPLINIHAPNTGAPKYIKQVLTEVKGKADSSTTIVGDFYHHACITGQVTWTENQ